MDGSSRRQAANRVRFHSINARSVDFVLSCRLAEPMTKVKIMSHPILKSAAAAMVLISSSGIALADHPGDVWMSMDAVKTILKNHGYSEITKMEADDNHWEGDGIKDGKDYEFHVDPHSGAITKDEPDDD